jgi:hypothetical protein
MSLPEPSLRDDLDRRRARRNRTTRWPGERGTLVAETSTGGVLYPDERSLDLTARRPRTYRRRWRSPLLAHLGVAGLLLTGLATVLAAAQTKLLLPQSARPLPNWLQGPLGNLRLGLGLGGLIVLFLVMFASYAVAVTASDRLAPRTVLMSIAALNMLMLLAPPLLSTDVFSYGAYGRMGALYGVNPYVHGPTAISLDPLFHYVGANWLAVPTAYSPLFTAISYVLAPLSIPQSVFAYKGIAALSSLVIVVVVWNAARERGLDPVRAVTLVGLNPVLLVYGVGGGHNDLLMLALLLTGTYVLIRRREPAGGALIVAATAVKLTGGLLLPFALASRRVRRGGQTLSLLGGAAAAAGAIAALALILFGTGPLHLLHTLERVQNQTGLQSVPGFISYALGLGRLANSAQLVLTLSCGVFIVYLLRRVWIGELDWIAGAGWATFAVLITATSLLPWYVIWMAPLAALSSDRRLFAAALVMTGLGLTSL